MGIWLLTLVAVAVSLIVAVRYRPPVWAATLLGVGQPLVAQLIYRRPLDAAVYVVLVVVGAVGGAALHRATPSFGAGPGPSRWLPWLCQALWGVGLLWVQHAERESDADGLQRALGAFVVFGALWTGFAVARLVRPHPGEATPAPVGATPRPDPVLVAHSNPAAAGLPAFPYAPAPSAGPASPWSPTHLVPPSGLDARPMPDPAAAVVTRLAAGLGIRVVERRGDWARVDAVNGWWGWVDARLLG